jgi:hypothetical protein
MAVPAPTPKIRTGTLSRRNCSGPGWLTASPLPNPDADELVPSSGKLRLNTS